MPIEGFSLIEGALPDLGLTAPFIWMLGPRAVARLPIFHSGSGSYRIAVRFRNTHENQFLTIRAGSEIVYSGPVKEARFDSPQVIAFHSDFAGHAPDIIFEISRFLTDPTAERPLGILIEDIGYCREIS